MDAVFAAIDVAAVLIGIVLLVVMLSIRSNEETTEMKAARFGALICGSVAMIFGGISLVLILIF